MDIRTQIKGYAKEDAESIKNILSKFYDVELDSLKTEFGVDEADCTYCDVSATFEIDNKIESLDWEYLVKGEDILVDATVEELSENLQNRIEDAKTVKSSRRSIKITSSKHSTRKAVFAAEGDEEDPDFASDDFNFDEPVDTEGDPDIDDTLEDVSDQLDDLQDTVDEYIEDDVSIDTDNNIDNHYIAECDHCHGVFISAVVLSDQTVDHISGICPLCEKESDQYLKWVIKPIEELEDPNV